MTDRATPCCSDDGSRPLGLFEESSYHYRSALLSPARAFLSPAPVAYRYKLRTERDAELKFSHGERSHTHAGGWMSREQPNYTPRLSAAPARSGLLEHPDARRWP